MFSSSENDVTLDEVRRLQRGLWMAGALAVVFTFADLFAGRDAPILAYRTSWAALFLISGLLLPRCGDRSRTWVVRGIVAVSIGYYVLMVKLTGGSGSAAFTFLPSLPLCAALLLHRDWLLFAVCGLGTIAGGAWVLSAEQAPALEILEWCLYALTGVAFGLFGMVSYAMLRRRRDRAIHERITALQELARTEVRFRALVENVTDAIILEDPRGKVLFASPAIEKIFGYPAATVIGLDGLDFVHPDDLPEVRASWEELLAHPLRIQRAEIRCRHASGEYRFVEVTRCNHLGTEGIAAVLLTFRDLTEQRRLERQLAVSDRMASVGSLAAGVAHEINNPLAYITSNLAFTADEMKRWSRSPPSPLALSEVAAAIEESREGVSRVRTIVRDLKTFSRPTESPLGPVDLAAVVDHALNIASNEIRHRATLVRELPPLPPIHSDAARLGQVVVNLLVNAAQAIGEGAATRNQIRISARDTRTGRVVLEISDTGCGIPAALRERIFDPFFTTKPVGIGTGLGLSICHNLVHALGGELEFESEVGKGTTFRITVPVAAAGETMAAPAQAHEPRAPLAARRVVVIDDEPMIARAVERALGKQHQVFSFTRAADALSRLDVLDAADLILCDLMMPELTGIDFYRRVAEHAPALTQRVAFMTGGAFTANAQQFLAQVKNVRLEKPFETDVLWKLLADTPPRAAAVG